jgi:antitoxin component of MazEF toxin-antitoxin module
MWCCIGSTLYHYQGSFTVIKKLTKHGNSWALVIDKPVLDLLKIDPETPLEISTDGEALVVTPARPAQRKKRFQAALEKVNRKYGRALKRLAE